MEETNDAEIFSEAPCTATQPSEALQAVVVGLTNLEGQRIYIVRSSGASVLIHNPNLLSVDLKRQLDILLKDEREQSLLQK